MRYRIAAALALTLFVLDLLLKPGGLTVTRAIDDVGQCAVAGVAAYCGLRRARRPIGALRSFGIGLAVNDLSKANLTIVERMEPDVVKLDWRLASSTGQRCGHGVPAESVVRRSPAAGVVFVADGTGERMPLEAVAAAGCGARLADASPADRTNGLSVEAGRGRTAPLSAARSPR